MWRAGCSIKYKLLALVPNKVIMHGASSLPSRNTFKKPSFIGSFLPTSRLGTTAAKKLTDNRLIFIPFMVELSRAITERLELTVYSRLLLLLLDSNEAGHVSRRFEFLLQVVAAVYSHDEIPPSGCSRVS